MRYTVEHYRAYEAPGTALGYEYVPTGEVAEVEAHDAPTAAAIVLASGEPEVDAAVSFDPGRGLYAVPGDEQAVRVTAAA